MGKKLALDPNAIAKLEALGTGDTSALMQLLNIYLESVNANLPKLVDALSHNQYEVAKSVSHLLKSSSANIGALSFRDLLQEIEQCAKSSDGSRFAELKNSLQSEYKEVVTAIIQEIQTRNKPSSQVA